MAPFQDPDIELYASIFNCANSTFHWENHLKYARTQSRFDAAFTDQWIAAIETFRQELGHSFLRQVRFSHPLVHLLEGVAPWQAIRLTQLSEVLLYLKAKDSGYESFRQKLVSSVAAEEEYMDFLRLGHQFRSMGLDLSFPIAVKNQTTPDIILADHSTGQIFNVEVSRLEESEVRQNCRENYNRLRLTLEATLTNPVYSAIQFQLTPADYPETLSSHLVVLQEKVAATNGPVEYTDEYISVTLFPETQLDALYTWMNEADRRKGFNGVPLQLDETRRISGNKIKRESKQLSKNRPGLIAIPVSPLHFWQQKVSATSANFQARMKSLPHLLGTFIYAECLHPDADQFRFNGDDGFARVSIAGPLTRYSLFVPNPSFSLSINHNTHKKLLGALSAPNNL
jgi:hypothetical protein